MKRAEKILTILIIVLFLFSIFNIGRVFAASDSLKITNVEITEISPGVEASISSFNNDTVKSNIKYHKLNDYVLYKVTLKNVDDEKHIIDLIVDNNDNDNLVYEYKSYKNTILEPGKTVEIYIKEVYRKQYNDLDNKTKKNSLKFTFNLIDEEKDESFIDIIINPATGDNIYIYFAAAGISLLALILLVVKNRNKTGIKLLGTLIAIALLSIPIATKALESKDSISFENEISFQDRFKVTYSFNGQTKDIIVNYNNTLERIKDPKKEGYKFKGWYQGDTKFDFDTKITKDINLTAKFEKNTYTITFNLDDGVVYNPSEIKISELPLTLENPYKLGYVFDGWTGSNGDEKEKTVKITSVDDDLEYTANFSPINYSISYIGLNSEELNILNNPTSYTIEDTITLNNPSNILDDNNEIVYQFVGWKDQDGVISNNVTLEKQTGNKTFEPIWQRLKPDLFSITYTLPQGAYFVGDTNPIEFNSGTDTFTLNNPVMDGYRFVGWIGSNGTTPEETVIIHKGTTKNLEFEAIFELEEYEISYNLDGGVVVQANPTTYTYNDNITLTNPTKRGYHFEGWTGTDLSSLSDSVIIPLHSTGNRSYTAHFAINTYNIDYILHGGTVTSNPDNYTVNDTITLNNPTKDGYTFEGWTGTNITEPTENVSFTNEINDKVFEANFIANKYHVIFDKNDSDAYGEMSNQEFEYDSPNKLSINKYRKTGYRFMGWTENSDGTGTLYADEATVNNLALSGNITLYAKWEKVSISILITGSNLNTRFKTIAGSLNNIQKIKYSTDVPQYAIDNGGTHRVSITTRSDKPTYIWWDEDTKTMYYGGEADVILVNEDANSMFNNLQNVTEIDTNFSTELTTKMELMFGNNYKLQSLDVSHFVTKNVTTMKSMFVQCRSMESYDFSNWDVSSVTTFQHMFNGNNSVQSLDLSNWHTDSATNMGNMFSSTYVMTSLKIDNFDTSKVQNMHGFCNDSFAIESLDFSNLDTSSVTDFSGFVSNDHSLTNIKFPSNMDMSKVTNTSKMFYNVDAMETLDLSMFDVSSVTNINNMFDGMTNIKTIYTSKDFTPNIGSSNPQIFLNDDNLEGGNGTKYADMPSNTKYRLTYAKIDDPDNGKPGYFTYKTKPTNNG